MLACPAAQVVVGALPVRSNGSGIQCTSVANAVRHRTVSCACVLRVCVKCSVVVGVVRKALESDRRKMLFREACGSVPHDPPLHVSTTNERFRVAAVTEEMLEERALQARANNELEEFQTKQGRERNVVIVQW